MNRNTRDAENPRIINRVSQVHDELLYTLQRIQESNLACGQAQLEYQYRPMTPGEEEISRIYEDEIYDPPDMIEKPGDLWITRSNMRPGENCSLQTAHQQPVVEEILQNQVLLQFNLRLQSILQLQEQLG